MPGLVIFRLDEAQHRCAALVVTWITLTDAAEGALATEESAHPSLGQVHPELQAAYLPLESNWKRHDLPEVPHSKLRIALFEFRPPSTFE